MRRHLFALVSLSVALLLAPLTYAQAPLSQRLGQITADAQFDILSADVKRRLDLTVADNLAVIASAARTHCNAPFLEYLKARGGAREALVPGCNIWLPADSAAAAIAFLIHAEEIDDSDFRAELRASAPIFAAALASAQRARADGKTFLTALAVGYSVQGAVAAPFGPLQPRAMSSGVWGPIGAAAAASVAGRLTPQQASQAIALAASASSGPFQYFYDQTEEKRIIIARAAQSGVAAASLVRHGESAAPRILEGRAGLFTWVDSQRAARIDPDVIVATAARLDGPLYLYPKFFAASSSIIPFLEGLDPVWRARNLTSADVQRVVLHAEPAWGRVLADKVEHFERPRTAIGAKINFSFVIALYMSLGRALPADFTPTNLHDEEVLALARKVQFETLAPGGGSYVTFQLKSGETVRIDPVRIDPEQPAPEVSEARRQKFATLTAGLNETQRATLWSLGTTVSAQEDISRWARKVALAVAP